MELAYSVIIYFFMCILEKVSQLEHHVFEDILFQVTYLFCFFSTVTCSNATSSNPFV